MGASAEAGGGKDRSGGPSAAGPGGQGPRPILEARAIVAGYTPELDILHGVSIDVRPDEIVALIGPNGAGKSTLMKAIFGLLEPREGRVLLEGRDITGWAPHDIVEAGVAYVPQQDNVFGNLTAEENLELGAWLEPRQAERGMERVLELFPDLAARRGQKVKTMSGGQRQMVAMGRALMLEPGLLMLDEPSAGLAPNLVDDVFDAIVRIAEAGTAILVVEQNAKKALRHADRGYVLDTGQNKFEGRGEELLEDPKVGRLYLGG